MQLITEKHKDLLDYKQPYKFTPGLRERSPIDPLVVYVGGLSNLFGLSHGWMCYTTNKELVNYEATHGTVRRFS